jgi:WhiB family redox-sensing transcriptional regulator
VKVKVNVDQSSEQPMDDTPEQYAWMLHARCRGVSPTEFFPSDGLGVEAAQRICAGCGVRTECLEYALAHRIEHGVWGGASERERRRIHRRRRGLAPTPIASAAPEPITP